MALEDPQAIASREALRLRYRDDAPPRILWNDTIAQILSHRSVRSFLPGALPEDTIETLVAAAQSAASSSNLQLWSVVAVTDSDKRRRLAEIAGQTHLEQAPLILLWIADLARAKLVADTAGEPAVGFEFLESYTVAAIDAALAAQNAVLAAESLGLGTVYAGAMRNQPEEAAAIAGLPPRAAVIFGLVVGWPDPAQPSAVKPRLPQEAVLHRESYALEAQLKPIARYDETARAFQTEQGQAQVGWRALLLARGRSAKSLAGRDRLKQALRTLGFALR